MDDCIFCKIVKGEIPSEKILEMDNAYAFMDIGPLSEGHCLFIPKMHAERAHEVSDDALSEISKMIKKVVIAAGLKDYNILQNNGKIANQAVMHAHWHLIPKPNNKVGLKISWNPLQDVNQKAFADKIRNNL